MVLQPALALTLAPQIGVPLPQISGRFARAPSWHATRSPRAAVLLHLASDVEITSAQRIRDEVQATAGLVEDIRIHCQDVGAWDLGALQLVHSVLHDYRMTRLTFSCADHARTVYSWLQLVR